MCVKFWDLTIALGWTNNFWDAELHYAFGYFWYYTRCMRNYHTRIPSRTLEMKCMRSGLPSEVHLPQSNGSIPSPRSLLSAHTPVYLHPRWWWSITHNREVGLFLTFTVRQGLQRNTGKQKRFCKSSWRRRAHLYFVGTKRKLNLTQVCKSVCTAITRRTKRSMLKMPVPLPAFRGWNEITQCLALCGLNEASDFCSEQTGSQHLY